MWQSFEPIPKVLSLGEQGNSVEWLQAVEFYNALRFNGKEVILLSYPGEGHGLRKYPNQKDFQIRMQQYFDHHLRGMPAPEWMTRGVPFLEKGKKARLSSEVTTSPRVISTTPTQTHQPFMVIGFEPATRGSSTKTAT